MQKCICKKEIKCFYLTKDNYEEFLKEAYPEYKNDYIILKVTDRAIIIESYDMVHVSREYVFGWWVEEERDYEYPQWCYCTDSEFEDKYMITS